MPSKALIPVTLGLGLGLIVLVLVVVLRRVWRHRKVPSELPYRKHSTAAKETTRTSSIRNVFTTRSFVRNEVPEFVIPETQIRLVQPVIIPPSPPLSARHVMISESVRYEKEDLPPSPGFHRALSASPLERKRKITAFQRGVSHPGLQPGLSSATKISAKISVQRSSSQVDLGPSDVSGTSERHIQTVSPLASSSSPPLASSSPHEKPVSRNPSVSSIDILAINVPPSTGRSPTSSVDESTTAGDSSRQSPEDSPRLFRRFRQSKHQIKLTGATVEFSLQYQISRRALILNVMRVRSVYIPVERKQDAKLCLTIHLKPDKFIWEAKTKIVQGTENPIFGEMFTITGFSLSKFHDCALLFRLHDSNVGLTIGEVTFSLRELQPDVLTSRSCQLQRPISLAKDKDRSYVGDLLVSLDYDPTNWKLNIRIIRARGLPKMTRGGHTDAFVKVNVMHNISRLFKRKTRVQHHEWNPEFDEGFDFELTPDQMASTSISMKVIHRGKLRDHLIGVVIVGSNVDPMETGYQHWAMILDKPNLCIEQWHKIYPVLK